MRELAHVIMETGKSHDLPSTSWALRRAGGAVQSLSKGLRHRGADGVTPSPTAGDEMRRSSSRSEAGKKAYIFSSSAFCSIQVLNGLNDVHLHWGGQHTLLSALI